MTLRYANGSTAMGALHNVMLQVTLFHVRHAEPQGIISPHFDVKFSSWISYTIVLP